MPKEKEPIQNAKKSNYINLPCAINIFWFVYNEQNCSKKTELVNYTGRACVQDCKYADIYTKETVLRVHGETLNGPRLVLLPLVINSHHEVLAFKRWVL